MIHFLPRKGMDDRSQFDLFEAMPGGVEGVRRVVDELHAAGVKVLIPYNPWCVPFAFLLRISTC